jgi:hypothetical protein
MKDVIGDQNIENLEIATSDAPAEEKNNTRKMKATSDLITVLVSCIMKVLDLVKAVGRVNVSEAQVRAFVETCLAFGNLADYQTSVTFEGVNYQVSDYLLHAPWVGLIPPFAIRGDGDIFDCKNVVVPYKAMIKLSPAEFAMTQEAILKAVKTQFQPVPVVAKAINTSSVNMILRGSRVHVENVNGVKEVPVQTKYDSIWYEDSYFNVSLDQFCTSLAYNLLK